MKRRREVESEIRTAIEELSMAVVKVQPPSVAVAAAAAAAAADGVVADDHHHQTAAAAAAAHIPTKPFLSLCNLVLQILDKIGPTMSVLRQDIHQNIQRLEKLHEVDPSLYSNVVEILKKEVSEGNAKKGPSCSKAFVWLTRSLDFTLALLQLLVKDFGLNMEQAVEESYNLTLRPWHGWISSAAFRVAIKLVPESNTLISVLLAKDEDNDMLKEEIQTFISLLVPLLDEIHSVLKTYGLDRLKST